MQSLLALSVERRTLGKDEVSKEPSVHERSIWTSENNSLIRIKLQQNIRLIMVHKLDSMLLKIASRNGSLLAKLLAIRLIGHTISDPSHLFDPIFV